MIQRKWTCASTARIASGRGRAWPYKTCVTPDPAGQVTTEPIRLRIPPIVITLVRVIVITSWGVTRSERSDVLWVLLVGER